MRKDGSFSVIQSHLVYPAYLKAQRQKEEEKRKKEEKKKAAAAAAANNNGFQLGDLWGNSAGSFSNKPSTGTGFGMMKQPAGPFGGGGFGATPTAASVVAATPFGTKKDTPNDLADKMKKLNIVSDPIANTSALPQFPGHYLYIDEERTDYYEAMGIDMSRYQQYLDMEKEMLMDTDDGETWQGEAYEKQHLPKGVDKQFKKFTERVECAPAQCVRYGFQGQPLFYSALHPQQQQSIASRCPHCQGPRVFEFQLMPNILSILPTTEYATKNSNAGEISGKAKNIDAKTVLDSWNVGMEFGTILVFVCQKDCHPGQMEDVSYVEEAIIVQYETD
ncbi:unnamed protein product [Mucor hiemalis]